MDTITLAAQSRSERKKQAAKRLRREGRVPAVVYGGSAEPVSVSVDEKEIHLGLHADQGMNAIFDLEVAGDKKAGGPVIARVVDRDPLTGHYVHVDFYRVDFSQAMVFSVPIEYTGTPHGVQLDGGVLERYLDALEVRCRADEVPSSITVDLEALGVGENIHVSEVDFGDLDIVTDEGRTIAAVHAPRVIEEVLPVDGEGEEGEEGEEGAEGEGGEEAEASDADGDSDDS